MSNIKLNAREINSQLIHFIENNKHLQENNGKPVALNIEGDAGLGKTSLVKQLAKERNLQFVKLNLSQLEDIGDLVGFPVRQFELEKDGNKVWADEQVVDVYTKDNYRPTGQNRTTNCPPEWLVGKGEGGILLLDDYSRANSRFMQATMELINEQTYGTWSLPKNWTIILTTNPDNADYHVTSMDDAQKTRFVTTEMKFDKDCWAEWAEEANVDSRCINFVLHNPELLDSSDSRDHSINPRSMTTFFNSISSLPNFADSLGMVEQIGQGCVGSEVSTMFAMFINNKLDKLISPDNILTKDVDYVKGALRSSIGEGDDYRSDISSILMTRIKNSTLLHVKNKTLSKDMLDRVKFLLTEEIFNYDIRFYCVKELFKGDKTKFAPLLMDTKIKEMVLK